jgi:hypothetical protein
LPDPEREQFLGAVSDLADAAGGWIDLHYDTVVHLARRA